MGKYVVFVKRFELLLDFAFARKKKSTRTKTKTKRKEGGGHSFVLHMLRFSYQKAAVVVPAPTFSHHFLAVPVIFISRVLVCNSRSSSSGSTGSGSSTPPLSTTTSRLNVYGRKPWRSSDGNSKIAVPDAIVSIAEAFKKQSRFAADSVRRNDSNGGATRPSAGSVDHNCISAVSVADEQQQQQQQRRELVLRAAEGAKDFSIKLRALADELEEMDRRGEWNYITEISSASGSNIMAKAGASHHAKIHYVTAQLHVAAQRCDDICLIATEVSSSSPSSDSVDESLYDKIEDAARSLSTFAVKINEAADQVKEFVEVHIAYASQRAYEESLVASETKSAKIADAVAAAAARGPPGQATWTEKLDDVLEKSLGRVLEPLKPVVMGGQQQESKRRGK